MSNASNEIPCNVLQSGNSNTILVFLRRADGSERVNDGSKAPRPRPPARAKTAANFNPILISLRYTVSVLGQHRRVSGKQATPTLECNESDELKWIPVVELRIYLECLWELRYPVSVRCEYVLFKYNESILCTLFDLLFLLRRFSSKLLDK